MSGNVNAAWYEDNVSRQVAMPFMPRHLLSGKCVCVCVRWGGGPGVRGSISQHDNAPVHTALLTKNVLHTNK